jgi:hypothetical protein
MATYKEIKGVTVQTLDSDPVINAGTWSTGGSMNTGRQSPYSNGTQSAAWAAAGYTTTNVTLNEHYNGTAWTEVADLNSARHGSTGGAGTTTAGLVCGGDQYPSPRQIALTETWDGSSWTEVSDMNTARAGNQIVGQTYTAALTGGGLSNNGNTYEAKTEKWDGTSWTETGDLNTARWGIQGAGTSTAASFNGGDNPSGNNIGNLEQFDGSSWTETTDSNNVRRLGGSSINSTYNDFIVFGGHIGEPETTGTATEFWNGSAWTELNDLGTAESNLGGAGTSSSGLSFAGTPQISQTEEFSFPPPTAAILNEGDLFLSGGTTLKGFGKAAGIPAATWASGGDLNTARDAQAGAGASLTAALSFGGNKPGSPNKAAETEQYNGTSWTETNDMNSGRNELGGSGAYGAALAVGGSTPPLSAITETWDGSTWTEVNDLNTARDNLSQSAGTQTANLLAGGFPSSPSAYTAITESWDGTSWTEVNDMNTGRGLMAEMGTQTAALVASGASGGPGSYSTPTNVESWDGTSWTEIAEVNTPRDRQFGNGIQTQALLVGGRVGPLASPPGNTANTELWNGSSWTEINNMSTARYNGSSLPASGGALNSIAAGGHNKVATTEEWTTDAALSTVTVS